MVELLSYPNEISVFPFRHGQVVRVRDLSNLFSCHNDFISRLLQRRQTASICGKGLTLSHM